MHIRHSVEQRQDAGVGLGDTTVFGDFEQDLETLGGAVLPHPIVTRVRSVDHDTAGDPESAHGLDRQFEVVEAERRRFGDQDHEIAAAHSGDHRA